RVKDFRAIVCVGGDGTANEVVNGFGLADGEIDRRPLLGLVPSGSAQDFARSVGVPLDRDSALQRLLAAEDRPIDVGRIQFADGRCHFFVNVLGVGFDAEVAGRAKEVRGAISSIPAHVVGFASALAAYRNKTISITFAGEHGDRMRVRCNMVVVANGPSYAGMMRLAPAALVDDGFLDVVVIGDVDKMEFLLNLPRALVGTHVDHEKVAVYRARSLALESEDDAFLQADGEVVGRLPARVDLLPRVLRLIR
ncbi:MAG: YegS/Rv2252/BmrU family lipid kinase, partial [Chloroflexi bacterium]|nr:YegS/Rv2252/BmrU family lipid kinase [Chloroflexota bacterium]